MKAWLLTLLALPSFGLSAEAPNVVLIVADDLNCAISPYGDRVAVTPNLERLAERSVLFERAYCQQAVCNPSRSSFLTGLRPDTVKVDDLRKSFRDFVPDAVTLPQAFLDARYFTQCIGKIFHNMGETKDRRSWSVDEYLHEGAHAPDTVFGQLPRPEGVKYKAPVTEAYEVPDTVYRDGRITERAVEAIRRMPEKGKPFFLAVGFWRPHLPFVAPKAYWDLYDESEIPMPVTTVPPSGAPEIALHGNREIRGYGLTPKDRPFADEEVLHYRHGYYASISFLDAQVGKLLDALEASGQIDNTIIVFTSDHGFHIGESGLWGKTTNFELDARVPLLISDPTRVAQHGERTRALSELVDLYPTLLDLAGLKPPTMTHGLEGVSLRPVLDHPNAKVKDWAFTQHQHPFYGSAENWKAWGYSVRSADWRYTEWRDISDGSLQATELYRYEAAEPELENLAEDPHFDEIRDGLAAALSRQFDLSPPR